MAAAQTREKKIQFTNIQQSRNKKKLYNKI